MYKSLKPPYKWNALLTLYQGGFNDRGSLTKYPEVLHSEYISLWLFR